jgi:sugar phosphate isomerase/epimerase
MTISRRIFVQSVAVSMGAIAVSGQAWGDAPVPAAPLFRISLGEYSLHRALAAKKLKHLDFAKTCKADYDIDGAEYWNMPFKDKVADQKYLADMKKRADDAGVRSLLILIDGEGSLGDPDAARREQAVANHFRWVEAARTLGCQSIRVNAHSHGSPEEQLKLVSDGLGRLCELAKPLEISVIVENHGGLSSDGGWVVRLMKAINKPNCGTLPDFGNFGKYDRYKGTTEMMPFAKAVSAKSHDFGTDGGEKHTDYLKMMKIVVAAGYRGYVGIEYEGGGLTEPEGIKATKKLLEKVRDQIAQDLDKAKKKEGEEKSAK